MGHQAGKDENSTDVGARIAQERKKRKEKRVKRLEKRLFLERMSELRKESNDNEHGTVSKSKLDCISHYGGVCVDCGASEPRDLELDHVDGDGHYHRAVLAYGTSRRGTMPAGDAFYRRLVAMDYPSNPVLAVRCKKCHIIKTAKNRSIGKNG